MDNAIYLELDSILDTRIATVDLIDPQFATELVFNNSYWKRNTDDFSVFKPDFNHKDYFDRYSKRNNDTLYRAKLTTLLIFLQSIKEKLVKHIIDSPEQNQLNYVVNSYPYQLSDVVKEDIVLALRHYLGLYANIEIRYIPYSQMTLKFIKTSFSDMFLYNFLEWLAATHHTFDPKVGAPAVSLYVPALFVDSKNLPTKDDVLKTNEGNLGPMESAKLFFAEFINLNFFPIENFSLIPPLPTSVSGDTK